MVRRGLIESAFGKNWGICCSGTDYVAARLVFALDKVRDHERFGECAGLACHAAVTKCQAHGDCGLGD
jgi:hypothetical protein